MVSSPAALLDEIRRRIERHVEAGTNAAIDGLTVSRYESPDPDYQLAEPLFVLMAQGGKRLYVDQQIIEYRAGDCLIVAASMPLAGHFIDASRAVPALAVGVRLEASRIASLLPRIPGKRSRATAAAGIATQTADIGILDPVARMLRLLDEPADAAVLAPLIEAELLWRLLRGPLGSTVAQIGLEDSILNQVGRAIAVIRENVAETHSVAALARVTGMSTATFHRHFHRLTGTTPLQFQKALQLQQARSLLLTEPSVADVAYRVGYSSPTQFNREYRRQFGAPPRQDAAVLRRQSEAARTRT